MNRAKPEDKFIIANNLNLHYLDRGNPSAVPMVLLHGLCGNAHYWDFFVHNVRDDYHILALDQRGHGDSGWAQSYGPKDYVLDLETFVAQLGLDNIALIGHSMGGLNAIIYAACHPEQASHLVIVDIGPEIFAEGIDRMETERASEPEAFDSEGEAIYYMRRIEPRQSDKFIRHQVEMWPKSPFAAVIEQEARKDGYQFAFTAKLGTCMSRECNDFGSVCIMRTSPLCRFPTEVRPVGSSGMYTDILKIAEKFGWQQAVMGWSALPEEIPEELSTVYIWPNFHSIVEPITPFGCGYSNWN